MKIPAYFVVFTYLYQPTNRARKKVNQPTNQPMNLTICPDSSPRRRKVHLVDGPHFRCILLTSEALEQWKVQRPNWRS